MAATIWLATLLVASLIGVSMPAGMYNTGKDMVDFGDNNGLTMECRCDKSGKIKMVVEYMSKKDDCEIEDFWISFHPKGSDDYAYCPFKTDVQGVVKYIMMFLNEMGIKSVDEIKKYAHMKIDDVLKMHHMKLDDLIKKYYTGMEKYMEWDPEKRKNMDVISTMIYLRQQLKDIDQNYTQLIWDTLTHPENMGHYMVESDYQLYKKKDFHKMMEGVKEYFSPDHLPRGLPFEEWDDWEMARAVIDVNRCTNMKTEKKYYSKGRASGDNTKYEAHLNLQFKDDCFKNTHRYEKEFERIEKEAREFLHKFGGKLLEKLKIKFPNGTADLGFKDVHINDTLHPNHMMWLNATMNNQSLNNPAFKKTKTKDVIELKDFIEDKVGDEALEILLEMVEKEREDIDVEDFLEKTGEALMKKFANVTLNSDNKMEVNISYFLSMVEKIAKEEYKNELNKTQVEKPSRIEEFDLVCEYKGMSHVSTKLQINSRTENMNMEMKLRLSLHVKMGGMWTDIRMKMGGDRWGDDKETGMVKIGDWIKVSVTGLPKGFYAGFRECRAYSKDYDYVVIVKENSFTASFMNEDWESHAVERHDGEYENAAIKFQAFSWSEKARTMDKNSVELECDVDICADKTLDHGFDDSACTKKGGSKMMSMMMGGQMGGAMNGMTAPPGQNAQPYGRKRRSVSTEPAQKLTMNFVVMGREECNSRPSVVNGKTSLTDDVKIGSQATFVCDSGFINKGAATQRCREMVQKADGLIYYRTATAWVPQIPPSCEDVNECLQNPCAASFECVNSIGSFLCRCPNGEMESEGACHKKKTFSGTLDSAKIIYSPKLLLKDSVEYKSAAKLLRAELTKIHSSIFNSALSVSILTMKPGKVNGVLVSYSVDVVETNNNFNLGKTGLQSLVIDYIRYNNPLSFDTISPKIYEYPHCLEREASNCHTNAFCIEENLSFNCKCHDGFKDVGPWEKPGRKCEKHSSHHQHDNHHDHDNDEYHMGHMSYHATKRLIIGLGAAVIVLLVSIVVIGVVLCCRRGRRYPVDDKVPLHS